mmetsp:Transcript_11112/g.15647  ORF Transcript_11112/g.15647 Transcript_11112/m.15647 type:complete len:89 (-) Transcript_11112:39-305(-)
MHVAIASILHVSSQQIKSKMSPHHYQRVVQCTKYVCYVKQNVTQSLDPIISTKFTQCPIMTIRNIQCRSNTLYMDKRLQDALIPYNER